jgi:hypothetical protein
MDSFSERFESKGWQPGPARHSNLSPVLAESGPYRILLRYWDPATDESMFEVRQMPGDGIPPLMPSAGKSPR